jgi:thiol-disulfide isomerase/thioredoxin
MNRRQLFAYPLLGLAGAARSLANRPAPPLQMVLNTGATFDLAAYRGKVVLLEILLTRCPACQHSALLLSRIQKEYGPRGLQVVGMAINQDAGLDLPMFTSRFATAFPVGVKTLDFARQYLEFPMVKNMLMPRLVFIDKKGIIRAHYGADEPWLAPEVEEKNIRGLLEKLLAEGASTSPAAKKKKS